MERYKIYTVSQVATIKSDSEEWAIQRALEIFEIDREAIWKVEKVED